MSEFTDAFEELLEATSDAAGKREFVKIDGKGHEAIISEISEDDNFVSGGEAGGGFRAMCRLSEFKNFEPNFQEAEARGKTHQVLNATRNNGYIELIIGDPVE